MLSKMILQDFIKVFFSLLWYYFTAYFNDLVVGAVCCRVEVNNDQKKLYIMTLGVLAPYRRLGIGMKVSDTENGHFGYSPLPDKHVCG